MTVPITRWYFAGMLFATAIGLSVYFCGGWVYLFSRFKGTKSHAGHIGYGRAPFAELPDVDAPRVIQWQVSGLETNCSFQHQLPIPLGTTVETGIRDDGLVVWRLRK